MNFTTSVRATALLALSALVFIECGGNQKALEVPTMPRVEPPPDRAPDSDAGIAQSPSGLEVAIAPAEPK